MAKTTPPAGGNTTTTKPDEKKEKKPRTSRFSELYPRDAAVKVLVDANPKRSGSKSAERFDHYFKSKTIGEFLDAGGRYDDVAYDVGRKHIAVG